MMRKEQSHPNSWVQILGRVRDRAITESIVVEFYPKDPKILRQECYRLYGEVAGTQNVTRTLTGATNQVPLLRGYAWEPIPRDRFGDCAAA